MVIIAEILLTLFVIFQITKIYSAIRNGRYLIGSSILPVKELIRSLQILEHANPNAFLRMKFIDTIQAIRIYKRQNIESWWFECSVPIKKEYIIKRITKDYEVGAKATKDQNEFFYLGSDSEKVSEMISQYFYSTYKCKENSKIQVVYKKTRVEESMVNAIIKG